MFMCMVWMGMCTCVCEAVVCQRWCARVYVHCSVLCVLGVKEEWCVCSLVRFQFCLDVVLLERMEHVRVCERV